MAANWITANDGVSVERKSFGWVWAGVGVVAVLMLVMSGVWRQSSPALTAPQNATPPIIVEPIQPATAAQMPALPASAEDAASATAGMSTAAAPSPIMTAAATGASASLPSDGPARVKAIQLALQAAGYSPGAADGKMGRQTQKAIREFQEAHGLSVDGKVGPRTWAKLSTYAPQDDASAGAVAQ